MTTTTLTANTVELTLAEIEIAKTIGGLRRVESMRRNLEDAHGYRGDNAWDVDIEGAAAELAYSKFRGSYWGGFVNNYKEADIGTRVQVRSTKLENGSLIVRANDNDDHYYVLVVGRIPYFRVAGWISGREAKNPKWLKSPQGREPAYFIPQSQLKKFKE